MKIRRCSHAAMLVALGKEKKKERERKKKKKTKSTTPAALLPASTDFFARSFLDLPLLRTLNSAPANSFFPTGLEKWSDPFPTVLCAAS